MKYRFSVTAYACKEVEIEADSKNEAISKIKDEMLDVDFGKQDILPDDREWLLLDD